MAHGIEESVVALSAASLDSELDSAVVVEPSVVAADVVLGSVVALVLPAEVSGSTPADVEDVVDGSSVVALVPTPPEVPVDVVVIGNAPVDSAPGSGTHMPPTGPEWPP